MLKFVFPYDFLAISFKAISTVTLLNTNRYNEQMSYNTNVYKNNIHVRGECFMIIMNMLTAFR